MSKKIIALSQNIKINTYNEIEDCINVRWTRFVQKLNYVPLYFPTINKEFVNDYFEKFQINGVILTGGNDVYYGNKTNETAIKLSKIRNKIENEILNNCINKNIPVLGVCRGMQYINTYLGGKLSVIKNHSGNFKHPIINESKCKFRFPKRVNTFHNYGIPNELNSSFTQVLAKDEQNNIEAFCHFEKKILGIMWHPEREKPFNKLDLNLIKEFFGD